MEFMWNYKLNTILTIVSVIFIFTYQLSIFSYASKLLVKSSSNKITMLFLATINTFIFILYKMVNPPFYILIIIFMVTLIIEFKYISKADYIQIFCGAAIFTLHFSAFIVPLIAIFSNITKTSPLKMLDRSNYEGVIIIIACTAFILAQELVKSRIDNTSIERATVKSEYSIMLSISIIFAVLFQIVNAFFLFQKTVYIQQVWLSLTTSISSLAVFYLFFLYAIKLIDENVYKHYSDKAKNEKEEIVKQKETLMKIMEKDELTKVYNRRYILGTLEKMCKEEEMFGVLFVDVNGLKYTNDTYGHNDGDRLLVRIADAILRGINESDLVARIGGDEFLVIIKNLTDQTLEENINKIIENIENENKLEEFLISASIGCVLVNEEIKKLGYGQILSLADENMRKNKKSFYENKGDELL